MASNILRYPLNKVGEVAYHTYSRIDPRIDPSVIGDVDDSYIVNQGASRWSKQTTKADLVSNNSIKFNNIKTQGFNTYIDKKWWIDYTVTLTFNKFPWPVADDGNGKVNTKSCPLFHYKKPGSKDVTNYPVSGLITFKPYPLHSATESIILELNNAKNISRPLENLAARMEYWDTKDLNKSCGFCPHRRMSAQDFGQMAYERKDSIFSPIGYDHNGDYGNDTIIEIDFNNCKIGEGTEIVGVDAQGAAKADPRYCAFCDATIVVKIREPVMADPLDYFSYSEAGPMIWNLQNINLTYNFNNLRKMICINPTKLYEVCKAGTYAEKDIAWVSAATSNSTLGSTKLNEAFPWTVPTSVAAGNLDWIHGILEDHFDDIVKVELSDVSLTYDVAVPPVPSPEPCRLRHIEYEIWKTPISDAVNFASGEYSKYMEDWHGSEAIHSTTNTWHLHEIPKELFVWVAPEETWLNNPKNGRYCTMPQSFASITHLSISYGSFHNILETYDQKDLFLMCLRNGLKGRTFYDWIMCSRNMLDAGLRKIDAKLVPELYKWYHAGVGSVIKLIPGKDIVTDGLNMTGGLLAANEGLTVKVDWKPMYFGENNIKYCIYLMASKRTDTQLFGGEGATISPVITSWSEVLAIPPVPNNPPKTKDEVAMGAGYGGSFWQKAKRFVGNANRFLGRTHLISHAGNFLGNNLSGPAGNIASKIGSSAAKFGYGYYGGGCGNNCAKLRGGKIIPPESFYNTY